MKRLPALLFAAILLGGCAAMNTLDSDVSSYGEWPAARKPGTYAFERLPSQQVQADATEPLEQAARPALEKAGFQPVAAGQEPDVLVQVGFRRSRAERSPWDDNLWLRGGFGRYRHGPWVGPGWGIGWRLEAPRYDREVGLLIRDRSSGKPLFEARAASEGFGRTDAGTVAALFSAALADFPQVGVNPRRVTVAMP